MDKRIKNIKTVIFDMDGVIFDSERLWKKSFKMANKKLGVRVSEKFRRTCSGIPFVVNLERLKELKPEINAEEYFNLAREIHNGLIEKESSLIKKGFIELIGYLKENKFKIGLCTGGVYSKVESLFKKHDIPLDQFDAIVSSDQVKNGKPDPESYLLVCERLKEDPKNCLVLEDSINGINAAFSAGAIPVMVIDIIKPDKQTKEKCFKIIKNLKQVKKLI